MAYNDDGIAGLVTQYRSPKHPMSRGARLYAQWQSNIRGGDNNPPFHELLPLVLAHGVQPCDIKIMNLIDSLQLVVKTDRVQHDKLMREFQQQGIASRSNRTVQVFIRCTR